MSLQLEWTEEELLATHKVVEPLVAGGTKCHGGFDEDGTYVSPRTANRFTTIDNWEKNRIETFGTPIMEIPLETWPENYPNVAQAKYLLGEGVRDPIVASLTRIGTVEGFGAFLRYSPIPDLQANFDEDVRGTSLAHLGGGLFEAHARDEAGYEDEGGHKQMWFRGTRRRVRASGHQRPDRHHAETHGPVRRSPEGRHRAATDGDDA